MVAWLFTHEALSGKVNGVEMEILCNDEKKIVKPGTVLATFLRDLDLDPDSVAVECEGVILPRGSYEDKVLQEGMVLEVIRFVGGGATC